MECNRVPIWLILLMVLPLSAHGRAIDLQGSAYESTRITDWSYRGEKGPDNWGSLSPAFTLCEDGRAQSPIDLVPLHQSRLPPLRFHYRTTPLKIRNDGFTIRMDFTPGSYLHIGARQYQLKELGFRTPSEHTVDGRHADMEIQLLHLDSAGNTVMLAIPVTAGIRHNAMLERIWEYLPAGKGTGRHYRQVGVNPVFFLPTMRDYFRYNGSLTDPPCSENVTWFVLQKPVEVPGHLIDRLLRIMGKNSRPVQKINGRSVLTSQ